METTPLVSIVIPVYNDADVIAGALESCLNQTLEAIEVVVVDDASTDETPQIVELFARRDPRVTLVRQATNSSAYQARRLGILNAHAEHLLFLDGDDELAAEAAETALAKAVASDADVVQFGVDVVHRDGSTGGGFEKRLQPRHSSLVGTDVLTGLFPIDQPAQGQLWRFLFRTKILREAYALMPDDLVLPRVNDLPITFLAIALAQRFASLPDRLYRYHFGRGGSGQKVHDLEWARFYAGAIHSIATIAEAVAGIADRAADPTLVHACYESVRRSIIGYTTYYLAEHTSEELRDAAFAHLYSCAPAQEIVLSTAKFWPRALDTLAVHASAVPLAEKPVRSVLLTTNILRTGGVSGVLLSQARFLQQAGIQVTIAAREPGSNTAAVPKGVSFTEIAGPGIADELRQWAELCRDHNIDLVIDHHWMYSKTWPAFALAARAEGAGTIGWAHNFAGRALLLGLKTLQFQTRNMNALTGLVVLSPLDVAFWKLRGFPRVSYLPNPPSPLLLDTSTPAARKAAPSGRRLELVWWGRLEQRTKRVSDLITIAAELDRLGVDFRLRIIGPDWTDMSAEQLKARANDLGVGHRVEMPGPLYGDDLIAAIDSADIFVNASVIEGYPLTLPEAQSRGLPVAMYELPWLALADGNEGLVTVPQGDAAALAARIAEMATDASRYAELSAASLAAAHRERATDFSALYQQLIADELPSQYSPEPTLDDARRLIDLTIAFTEQHSAKKARSRQGDEHARKASGSVRTEKAGIGSRMIRLATPAAKATLDIAPWLRPTAEAVKHRMLRR